MATHPITTITMATYIIVLGGDTGHGMVGPTTTIQVITTAGMVIIAPIMVTITTPLITIIITTMGLE